MYFIKGNVLHLVKYIIRCENTIIKINRRQVYTCMYTYMPVHVHVLSFEFSSDIVVVLS